MSDEWVVSLIALGVLGILAGGYHYVVKYLIPGITIPQKNTKERLRTGAFVQALRTDVRIVVARLSLCVVEEFRIERGLPMPPLLKNLPGLNRIANLRDATTVRMIAKDNRVQYYIEPETLTEECLCFDPENSTLYVSLPPLILDEEIVEVQTDPDKIWFFKEKGVYDQLTDWFRGATEQTKKEMLQRLRQCVIREAGTPQNLEFARRNASAELSNIIQKKITDSPQFRTHAPINVVVSVKEIHK